MANVLTTDLPTGQTLEMPCNNLLATRMGVGPDVSTLGRGVINQTLFVDAVNFAAVGADGSIGKPFQTLQQAVQYSVLQGWTSTEFLIAPATYAAPVLIPFGRNYIFRGWDPTGTNQPLLGGDITINGDNPGPGPLIEFVNVNVTANNITAAAPLVENLRIGFEHSVNAATITCLALQLTLKQSQLTGEVASTGDTELIFDGPSWSYFLIANPPLPANPTLTFRDAGHDTYPIQLAGPNIAIGATGFYTIATTGFMRQNDRVSVQATSPAAADFFVLVHEVAAGSVVLAVHNVSRASQTFTDNVLLTVHHMDMVQETAPAALMALGMHAFDAQVDKLIAGG